jgi:hypothetical protein
MSCITKNNFMTGFKEILWEDENERNKFGSVKTHEES